MVRKRAMRDLLQDENSNFQSLERMAPKPLADYVESFQTEVGSGLKTVKIFLKWRDKSSYAEMQHNAIIKNPLLSMPQPWTSRALDQRPW